MYDGEVKRLVSIIDTNAMQDKAMVHGRFITWGFGDRFLRAAAVAADPVKTLIESNRLFWPRPRIDPPRPAKDIRTILSITVSKSSLSVFGELEISLFPSLLSLMLLVFIFNWMTLFFLLGLTEWLDFIH